VSYKSTWLLRIAGEGSLQLLKGSDSIFLVKQFKMANFLWQKFWPAVSSFGGIDR
jgi:hypothetical protein